MKKVNARWLFVVCLALTGQVEAGSIFSFNGQGYPLRRLDARATGMGGTGRALVDGSNLASFNPALLGGFQRPAMFAQFALQRRSVKDANTSLAVADGDVAGIKVVFPFHFRGAFSVGVEALTDVDITVVDTLGTGGERHLLGLKGTGGIGAIVFGFGQKVGDKLFIGAQADLMVVGTLTESWSKDLFNDTQAFFSLDNVTRSQKGAQFTLGVVFTPSNLSIAVVAKPKATVTQRILLENRLTSNAITASAVETKREIRFPATIGFGLAYAKSRRWVAAVDAEYAAWADTGPGRHDMFEVAAGIQYQTRPGNSLGIGRRYDIMGGVYRRTLYFATTSGDPISEIGVSAGLAVPFKGNSGAFRWTVELGRRGDVQAHGASETFIKQTFSIAGLVM
jgi:hypothetical protein